MTTTDRFQSQARAECERAYRRTNDPACLSLQSLLATEHQLRARECWLRTEPIIRVMAGMIPVGGFSFQRLADGSLGERTDHWSDQQRKDIERIDALIAWHRYQCGLGPERELPGLGELIGSRE